MKTSKPTHWNAKVSQAIRAPGLLALSALLLSCSGSSATVEPAAVEPLPSRPVFTDVAEDVGLDFRHGAFRWGVSGDPVAMMGGGLCWLDYNRDGWQDLFVVNSYALEEAGDLQTQGGLPTSALFRNDGGAFTDVSQASGTALPLRGNGCVAADLDRDGWTDLYITTARTNVLLWNNGDGTFSDGSSASSADAFGWHTAASAADLNQDGWPDLFVAGYVDINNKIPDASMGFPNTHYGRRDLLMINEGPDLYGRPTFREVGAAAGLEADTFEYGLGALLTDLDRDGDLDLFVANDTNPNRLYEYEGWEGGIEADPEGIGFRFVESGETARVDDRNSGMGVAGADYDGDGRFDLIITNLGDQLHSVYRNLSDPQRMRFAASNEEFGIADLGVGWTGWGISWADLDLDTDLDLLVINGGVPVVDPPRDGQLIQAYENLTAQGRPGVFEDYSLSLGLSDIGPLIGRGSAVADYDNDGDLDVAINSIGSPLVLLENNGAAGHWLEVELEGFQAGAVVTVILPDGAELRREIHAGSSYQSSEDPRCHFGLGAAGEISELRVDWPDGRQTRLENVAADQILRVSP